MSAQVIELRLRDDANAVVMTTYVPKHKLNGTTAPGVSDDDTAGYAKGSVWIDATNKKAYVCVDNTTGAAVWLEQLTSGSVSTVDASAKAFSWMGF